VLAAARRARVRTVMTLHDYWPICPGNVLLRGGESVCEPRSCGRLHTAAVTNRCVQGSIPRSALAAFELTCQSLTRSYTSRLDALISPSRFLRDQIARGGFSAPRFDVVPNAVVAATATPSNSEASGLLYAGRLSPEKGLSVLIQAASKTGTRLVVAGEGPSRPEIERLPFVEYLGMLEPERLMAARKRTVGAVVGSVWYENAPMAILESMACGRPVIATTIGGIPELLHDGIEGLLVRPSDVESLASAMCAMSSTRAAAMGESARKRIASHYSPELHIRRLEAVYRDEPSDAAIV